MGAVILPALIYDDAKRLGHDMRGYVRAPTVEEMLREGAAARKKLGQWAQRGGK
jgi:hypothetical protein